MDDTSRFNRLLKLEDIFFFNSLPSPLLQHLVPSTMLILDKNYFNKKRNIKNHLRDSFKNYNCNNYPEREMQKATETRDTMIIEKLADREFFCL